MDEEEEYGADICGLNTIDRETGKPRLLSAQCATCVGRPGNKMDLRPGRLLELVNANLAPDTQPLICHSTIGNADCPPAYCAWFMEKFGHMNGYARIVSRLGGFTEVAPPRSPQQAPDTSR